MLGVVHNADAPEPFRLLVFSIPESWDFNSKVVWEVF